MAASISWRILPFEEVAQTTQLVPFVDGRAPVERIAEFEERQGFRPAGGYAGLVPADHHLAEIEDRLLREQAEHRIALLGCDCGDLGCWPLLATVRTAGGIVTWSDFAQPHRPDRDYDGFGPFAFDETAYRRAIAAAGAE